MISNDKQLLFLLLLQWVLENTTVDSLSLHWSRSLLQVQKNEHFLNPLGSPSCTGFKPWMLDVLTLWWKNHLKCLSSPKKCQVQFVVKTEKQTAVRGCSERKERSLFLLSRKVPWVYSHSLKNWAQVTLTRS